AGRTHSACAFRVLNSQCLVGAVMATVDYPLGTDAGGAVIETLHYDDQSLQILDVTVTNNAHAGRLILTLYQKGTQTIVFGPRTYTAGSGVTVEDLSSRNLQMVHDTGTNKYGVYDVIVPPVDYAFLWRGQ